MATMSRRLFLMCSAALPLGCGFAPTQLGGRTAAIPAGVKTVRSPAAGQSWRYARRDAFTGQFLDYEIASVSQVNGAIQVHREKELGEENTASSGGWGVEWLKRHRPAPPQGSQALASEVQEPWGHILVDPHWDLVQVYKAPIPLWPQELRPGWRMLLNTAYKTPADDAERSWQLTMHAHGWETIRVPAGEFVALRYMNRINFTHSDEMRYDSIREESIWLAPEIGRWVARVSTGTYYINDSAIGQPFNENPVRWELLSWA